MVCAISSMRLEPSRQMEIRGPQDCRLLSKALGGGGRGSGGAGSLPQSQQYGLCPYLPRSCPGRFPPKRPHPAINVSRTQTHLGGGVHLVQPYFVQMGKLGAGGMGFARNQARDSAGSGWILGFPDTPTPCYSLHLSCLKTSALALPLPGMVPPEPPLLLPSPCRQVSPLRHGP